MVVFMFTTFLLLFAFVINTGMLVNAKINLQNAADVAAYAGAAVQARQLTYISYLNYEMRRQWKKFLFRIYIIANQAQDAFADAQGKNGPMQYYPNAQHPGADYLVPSTCIIFNANDNYCHLEVQSKIIISDETYLDQIADTLRSQLQQIESIRQNNCHGIGLTNLMVNLYWLYNTDPSLQNSLNSGNLGQAEKNTLNIVQSFTTGLGIVPRELILKYRIQTLASYLNTQAQLGITSENIASWQQGPDPAMYERSIQAFQSAYYTLGNHTFPQSTISMDELLPSTVLLLQPILQAFDTWAIDPILQPADANGAADCANTLIPISVTNQLTLGFFKDPSVLTYYAVRLKAKARVLFSPFGDIELKAYSAAQPFGSRIGPNLPANAFAHQASAANQSFTPGSGGTTGYIPNLPVLQTDPDVPSANTGWNNQAMVTKMFQIFSTNNANGSSIEETYLQAMAPNPYEATRYNIINDLGQDPNVRNFGTDGYAAFWAPVFSPAQNAAAIQTQIQEDFQNLFSTNAQTSSSSGAGAVAPNAVSNIQQTVTEGFTRYLSQLSNSQGETQGSAGEGMNIARLQNPFLPFTDPTGTNILNNPDISMFLTDASILRSSWSPSFMNAGSNSMGGVGYSVKFVSFQTLTSAPLSSNGSTSWSNAFQTDTEAAQDIPYLKH
jgi:hypothetical protein